MRKLIMNNPGGTVGRATVGTGVQVTIETALVETDVDDGVTLGKGEFVGKATVANWVGLGADVNVSVGVGAGGVALAHPIANKSATRQASKAIFLIFLLDYKMSLTDSLF
jgi:hypothetical protein